MTKENEGETEAPALSTFNDLVLYDEQGKPYIDVNKLVYNPKSRAKKEMKERVSWYFFDYLFIVCNFLSLIVSAYLLAIGLQATLWDQSIESIIGEKLTSEKNVLLLKVFKWTPSNLGMVLLAAAVLNAINVFLGVYACLYGFKILLIQHVIVDVFIILVQVGIGTVVIIGGTCHETHIKIFHESFELLIREYLKPFDLKVGSEKEKEEIYYATQVLNDIQTSMQCCGAANWTDYMNTRVTNITLGIPSRRQLKPGTSNQVFPYSCCQPWWIRNVHCSEGVHVWTYPSTNKKDLKKFRERISQTGCTPKIWLACTRLIFALGQGLILNAIVNFLFLLLECWSVIVQIRVLGRVVRELKEEEAKKKSMHHKGYQDNDEDISDDEEIHSVTSGVRKRNTVGSLKDKDSTSTAGTGTGFGMQAIEDLKTKLALPTEDEIEFIKSRTAFAHFELRMKRTNIGKLMSVARNAVAPEATTRLTLDGEGLQLHHHHHGEHHHRHHHGDIQSQHHKSIYDKLKFPLKTEVDKVDEQRAKRASNKKLLKKNKKELKEKAAARARKMKSEREDYDAAEDHDRDTAIGRGIGGGRKRTPRRKRREPDQDGKPAPGAEGLAASIVTHPHPHSTHPHGHLHPHPHGGHLHPHSHLKDEYHKEKGLRKGSNASVISFDMDHPHDKDKHPHPKMDQMVPRSQKKAKGNGKASGSTKPPVKKTDHPNPNPKRLSQEEQEMG